MTKRDEDLALAATLGSDAPTEDDTGGPVTSTLDEAPARIGRYVVGRRLGAGGMGVVHAAHDPELERPVAIKVVRERAGDGSGLQERLRREAQALAKLHHPNVVSVFDVGVERGRIYIVMQLVDGDSIDRWIAARRPAAREIVALFAQAGRGLAAAHAAGLVHRDFKPGNVLVERDGTVRVTDFGLALLTDLDDATSDFAGTPAYMAPEQFEGGAITPATDQFGFCVALWEALAGSRPFGGDSITTLRKAVLESEAEPEAPPAIPRRVLRVLRRGLARRPDDRYPSMTALLAELAPPRRRWVAALAAGGLVVTGAAIALATTGGERASPCAGVAAPADAIWSRERAHELEQGFGALGHPLGRELAPAAIRQLDQRVAQWKAVRIAACEATHVHRSQPPEVLAYREACLDRSLRALRATIDAFAKPDAAVLSHALAMVNGTDPQQCTADAAGRIPKQTPTAPPELVDRYAALETARLGGRLREVAAHGFGLARDIEATGDLVLASRVWWSVAQSAAAMPTAQAREASRKAAEHATTIGDDVLSARAWTYAADLAARAGDFDRIEDLLAMARGAATRSGSRHARLNLELTTASIAIEQGELDAAITTCRQVLAELDRPDDVGTVAWIRGLECVHDASFRGERWDDAEAASRRLLEFYVADKGAAHPFVIDTRAQLAKIRFRRGEREAARAELAAVIADYETAEGPVSFDLMDLLSDLALLESDGGNVPGPEALAASERALAIGRELLPDDDPMRARLLWIHGNLISNAGDLDGGIELYTEALAVYDRIGDVQSWSALAYNVADADRLAHRCDRARPRFERIADLAAASEVSPRLGAVARAGVGACQLEEGDRDAALATLTAAADELTRLGDAAFAAQTRLWIAELHWKAGRKGEARRIAREVKSGAAGDTGIDAMIRQAADDWFLAPKQGVRDQQLLP